MKDDICCSDIVETKTKLNYLECEIKKDIKEIKESINVIFDRLEEEKRQDYKFYADVENFIDNHTKEHEEHKANQKKIKNSISDKIIFPLILAIIVSCITIFANKMAEANLPEVQKIIKTNAINVK